MGRSTKSHGSIRLRPATWRRVRSCWLIAGAIESYESERSNRRCRRVTQDAVIGDVMARELERLRIAAKGRGIDVAAVLAELDAGERERESRAKQPGSAPPTLAPNVD